MTVLAVCGPKGSKLKEFADNCLAILKSDKVAIIDTSAYETPDLLLEEIKAATSDVIVYGTKILLDENVFSQCDIRVFLHCDASSCVTNLVMDLVNTKTEAKLDGLLDTYLATIKSQNENIRQSAKKFDFEIPENHNIELSTMLFIDAKGQKLIPPKFERSSFSDKLNFYKPDYGFEKRVEDEITTNLNNGF